MALEKPLTAQQAAAFLQISARLVFRLIDSGQLAGRKVGSRYRTTDAACIAYLHSPPDIKSVNTVRNEGRGLSQQPTGPTYDTGLSTSSQAKELDDLLKRVTKSKRRRGTPN